MIREALAALLLAQPVAAQGVSDAQGGVVRWLDKVSGRTADLDLSRGQSVVQGRLTIQMDDCRYPTGDPASNAYAHLTIIDSLNAKPVFSGWMIASSPALSAMDHPRYDVWVLRCDTN
ncbi:MAG: DUF2155 domain-containing protein [Cereibacter sphaeroides]|uniref:DUF2155 domain-containing protein n=1 Tax=Cereibacter sphaeroides TaxID=1063 RepID=A0A2W5UCI6_CERSP|nr:MAG: DUF2155 domain-containing protein [Cereibacter sphaeroides]